MQIMIFGKETCARCRSTKHKLEHLLTRWNAAEEVPVAFHDMDTVDGMVEAAFHDVVKVPTVVIRNGTREIMRWGGVIPPADDMKRHIIGDCPTA